MVTVPLETFFYEVTFVCLTCFQATAVLTSKHFAQRQPWWRCAAATPRSTAAVLNWSWMSPRLSWGLATSARPWGQSSQPPRGLWLPRAEPCPPPSGPCWPALTPWCWKLSSESSPTLSVLTGTTHMVGIWNTSAHGYSCTLCFTFPMLDCGFSHLDSRALLLCHLSHLLVCFPWWLFVAFQFFVSLSPTLLLKCFVSPNCTKSLVKHYPWECRGDSTEIG